MKTRADQALVERGLVESRTRASALIMAGLVFSGTVRVAKAGQLIVAGQALEVRGQDHPWVSRGGVKLEHALSHFGFDVSDRVCLDVGASTGGFTDVLLQRGASRVFAVDVGHGQLAWRLRTNERVTVMERTNARYLTTDIIDSPIGVVVCDASFIGLSTVLPAPLSPTSPDAWAVALIKPQFEAGPGKVGNGGVVRDPAVHREVCDKVERWWSTLPDWRVVGVEKSPITGPEGNIEFLIGAVRKAVSQPTRKLARKVRE